MRIKLNTTMTAYTADTVIKPKHAFWTLKNVGEFEAHINDVILLAKDQEIKPGVESVLIPVVQHYLDTGGTEPIEIINETQFTINFVENIFLTGRPKKVILFETQIKLEP